MKTTFGNASIDRLPKQYKERVHSISDERKNGDGFWIYLKKPWVWDNEVAIVHEQTVGAAIQELKYTAPKKI